MLSGWDELGSEVDRRVNHALFNTTRMPPAVPCFKEFAAYFSPEAVLMSHAGVSAYPDVGRRREN